MRTPRRDEHCLPRPLINPMALHPILLEQFPPHLLVQIHLLPMNRVIIRLPSIRYSLPQELPQLLGVIGAEEIPGCDAGLAVWAVLGVKHDVDSVRHIHVKTSRAF